LPRNVPNVGKYNPTVVSNTKKPNNISSPALVPCITKISDLIQPKNYNMKLLTANNTGNIIAPMAAIINIWPIRSSEFFGFKSPNKELPSITQVI
jgi:hypothetical protein